MKISKNKQGMVAQPPSTHEGVHGCEARRVDKVRIKFHQPPSSCGSYFGTCLPKDRNSSPSGYKSREKSVRQRFPALAWGNLSSRKWVSPGLRPSGAECKPARRGGMRRGARRVLKTAGFSPWIHLPQLILGTYFDPRGTPEGTPCQFDTVRTFSRSCRGCWSM